MPKSKAPTILFIWGPGRIVPVRINTFAVEEQLNNPMLYPLRAKVSLGMQVLTDADFGSDPDTIEKLAIAAYKFTMTQKRVLALANTANGVESDSRPAADLARRRMLILVILSAAKDLTERSDTRRAAGVRSFAALRTTGKQRCRRLEWELGSSTMFDPNSRYLASRATPRSIGAAAWSR